MAAVGLSLSWRDKNIRKAIMMIINRTIDQLMMVIIITIMMTLTLKAATILLVICALVGIRFKISSSDGATASAEDYHYHTFYRL